MIGKIFVGFDLETGSAFDDENRKIITEIGAVKYVYTSGGFKPIDIYSCIVNEGMGVHADAVEYTGITPKLVEDFGINLLEALIGFEEFLGAADYVVSHNGDNFDLPVMRDAYEFCNPESFTLFNITNIDTLTCVPYPKNCKSKNLTYLQAFYGFVNPFPHRAFSDVLTMMKVLENFNIDEAAEVAGSPAVSYSAKFSYPKESKFPSRAAYAQGMKQFNNIKDQVKGLGFRWNPDRKLWIYEGKQLIFERDIQPQLTCPVQKL